MTQIACTCPNCGHVITLVKPPAIAERDATLRRNQDKILSRLAEILAQPGALTSQHFWQRKKSKERNERLRYLKGYLGQYIHDLLKSSHWGVNPAVLERLSKTANLPEEVKLLIVRALTPQKKPEDASPNEVLAAIRRAQIDKSWASPMLSFMVAAAARNGILADLYLTGRICVKTLHELRSLGFINPAFIKALTDSAEEYLNNWERKINELLIASSPTYSEMLLSGRLRN